jgi:hypothetical protein
MTLNANLPTDQALVSTIPSYIREDREAINAVSGSGNVGSTTFEILAGSTSLTVGVDIGSYGLETLILSAAAAVTIDSILGGVDGMMKVIIFQDSNISLTDGPKNTGQLYLNHLPALSDFAAQQDDILCLVNIGGDGGASTHGYWKEVWRQISLK